MALGANSADIARIVLREGVKVALIGSAVGLLLALPLGNAFNAMFPGMLWRRPSVPPGAPPASTLREPCGASKQAMKGRTFDGLIPEKPLPLWKAAKWLDQSS